MRREPIQFKELELLGEGSQGQVYKAVLQDPHSDLAQTVAIKILHSETAVDLWRQEFESLHRVRSPYCVQVLSFERLGRKPALILEYVDGLSLAQLGQTLWLEKPDLEELAAQLECALKDLHRQGIFHGDLSPQNVLLDRSGRVRLLDFGLANCNSARPRLTPAFCSPERLAGGEVNGAADLFALGRVLEFLSAEAGLTKAYLALAPSDRRFQDLSPCPARQNDLGVKIRDLQERRARLRDVRTRTIAGAPTANWLRPRWLAFAVAVLAVMVNSSASSSRPVARLGQLILRTRRWHSFAIDGRPLGFSPVSIPLSAGQTYDLSWQDAHGRGHRKLALREGEVVQMEDRDFSH